MSLYTQLVESLSQSSEPDAPTDLRERSLIAFAPRSTLGLMHLKGLIAKGARFVLAVDDFCTDASVDGIPLTTSKGLLAQESELRGAVVIDFSQSPYTQALCAQLAKRSGHEVRDILQVLACFNAASVYEPVQQYRAHTLARADDWLKLAQRLGDDASRETLYGILLQRLEYDRRWIRDIRLSARDEYFGFASESNTFVLGEREHFVDCGAHRGTVLQKMLAVTRWRYASIYAFEPDAHNFAALKNIAPWSLEHCYLHACAVSNEPQTLQFRQTGTMGSRITETGTETVSCVRLDDTVEHASFIKMDVEGFETRALKGASQLLKKCRPRLAVASYHYAADLLDIAQTIDTLAPGYTFYLRHHFGYFYDTILYATPRTDWLPLENAA